MNKFACVLMGDQSLLIECGHAIADRGHTIVAVVTGSDQVASWAQSQGIPTLAPGAQLEADLSAHSYDWFFSIANLRIVPTPVWQRARAGAANFHDGPLPRSAGLNTPAWAILRGETQHGVSWHAMTEGVDEGDVYASLPVDIADDDTALMLNAKCFEAGIATFTELIGKIESATLKGEPQDLSRRSYFAKNARPEAAAVIDFTKPTADILRLARALDTGSEYAKPLGLPKIRTAKRAVAVSGIAREMEPAAAPAGTVVSVDSASAVIATADGAVRISEFWDEAGSKRCPLTLLQQGQTIAALSADEAAKLTALWSDLAKHEDYFRNELQGAASPVLPGLTQATSDQAPEWETTHLSLPEGLSGDSFIGALACFFARTGNRSRFQLAFADDALAARAAEFPGLVAPSVPLTFEAGAETTIETLYGAAEKKQHEARRRPGYAADLIASSPELAAGHADVGVRLGQDAASGPVAGSALTLALGSDGRDVALSFDRTRISAVKVQALRRQMESLFAALADSKGADKVADLPILSPAEIHELVVERNRTEKAYERDALVHQLIARQASATPDLVALACAGETLTYRELDQRAERIADVLVQNGVGPDVLVGLHLRRSCDLVVGALAILKAGGAYVPLDPGFPEDRLAMMIEDAKLGLVLTEKGLQRPHAQPDVRFIDISAAAAAEPTSAPRPAVRPDNLAYVIFTSGSTGRPKGVMVEHRNVVNFFAGMQDRIPSNDGEQPVWLAVTSLSFDISVLELFWTLAHGFKVVIHTDTPRVAARKRTSPGSMDFSLFFWGNDDGPGPRKYQLLLDSARFADAHGFGAVWTPERHFHAFGGPYPNPSVTGAAVAAVTKNIAIRAGSCVLPLHHPARVAEEWAIIDNLSNGRAGLAFASGWMPEDFLLRPENAPPNNKNALLRDIEVVRRLWRGEAVSFEAPNGKQVDVITQPRPVSRELPVWLTTAGNPQTYKEAGEMGAHLLTHLLGQSVAEVAEKIKIYRQALADSGRNPADYTVTLMLHTLIGQDREEVRAMAREPMKAYLRSAAALIKQYAWTFPAFKKPQGVSQPMDIDLQSLDPEEFDAIIEFAFLRYFDNSGLFGTVEDALARVAEVKAAGVDEIACLIDFGLPAEKALIALEPLAEVVAAVREPVAHNDNQDEGDGSIGDLIARHGVTHMQCTPSMAAMILMSDEDRRALAKIRHLFIGGEALKSSLVGELKQATEATIENMYGPTETTIWSATGPVSGDGDVAPLGTPIANTQLYILDDMRRLVPAGVPGELFIAGDGVTRGYLGREDLTSERFLADPFVPAGRMYRTGDLVEIDDSGAIRFLGRVDHQVKVRGYRIELGEIEARVASHPAVAECVVIVRADQVDDVRIVAYVRFKDASVPDGELKKHASQFLPDYMVPAHFVSLKAFPLTPNAKVDRNALPRVDEVARARPKEVAAFVAPSGDLQREISEAFQRLLGISQVGASDNFFELGGHSLLAVQLHRTLKASVAPMLTITDIYRFPTVAGLAGHIQDGGQAQRHLGKVAERAALRRNARLGQRGPAATRVQETT